MLGYEAVFFYTLRCLPHSFTLGEASVVVQGFILFMYNTMLFLFGYATHLPSNELQQVSVVVQVYRYEIFHNFVQSNQFSLVDACWSGCNYCSDKMVQAVSWRSVLRTGYCDWRHGYDIPSTAQRSPSDSGSICLWRLGTSKYINELT